MFSLVAATLFASSAALVSAATNHPIIVGGSAGLVFSPPTVTAEVGDTITFEFQVKNHTVTQSSFAAPCALLTNETTNQVGFDSGFVPVADDATKFPAWTLEVTSTDPLWFYCAQEGHCAQGMVGAVNAPASGSKTFDAFLALAKGGEAAPTDGTTTTDGSTTADDGTTSDDGSSPEATDTPDSAAAITRPAVGALAAVAAAFLLA